MPDEADEEKEEDDGLTEEERLAAKELKESFGIVQRSEEEILELEPEKGYFYVLDENNIVIDCARIYSFNHEDMVNPQF